MKKLLIIDGSFLLFQSFFGMPNKIINKNKQRVEAVVCFLGILLKTIRTINPDKLLVVFDGENKLERKEIDEDYKANRIIDNTENPFDQLELIKNILTYLNFCFFETINCEGDDYIASIVNNYKNDYKIVISSNDKDFFQLIDENVYVYSYRGKLSTLWTKELIFEKYGFNPEYFTTLKALMGDSSDNIKGIKGVGIKTATNLIKSYGELNSIIHESQKQNNKILNLIKINENITIRNYKIINLKNANVKLQEQDYNFIMPSKSSTEILKEINLL